MTTTVLGKKAWKQIDWSTRRMTPAFAGLRPNRLAANWPWYGSVVAGYQDKSGLVYMRNRQYEPGTGSVSDVMGNQFRYHYGLTGEPDSLYAPNGIVEGYGYDADANLARKTSSSAGSGCARDMTLVYDGRGKLTGTTNVCGIGDTTSATYSGLGHTVTSSLWQWGKAVLGIQLRFDTNENFTNDGLADLTYARTRIDRLVLASGQPPRTESLSDTYRTQVYQAGTGRLLSAILPNQRDTLVYDGGGNTIFSTQALFGTGSSLNDRASYYAAGGKVAAAEYRTYVTCGNACPYTRVFEDNRYDALGRRVLVHNRRYCTNYGSSSKKLEDECNNSYVRRTVWDGAAELYEIQMPAGSTTPSDTIENDTAKVQRALSPNQFDPNPYFGRVAYTNASWVDHPLSVVRFKYADAPPGKLWGVYATFAIVPFYNGRGNPDLATFVPGGSRITYPGDTSRSVLLDFPTNRKAYGSNFTATYWHGTLLNEKRDETGTFYRRNRTYDPATGRFTALW